MIGGLVSRLQGSPWVRRLLIGGVGLAVFLLGATYLSLRYPSDVPTFMVVGGEQVAVGYPTVLRVRARMADARSRLELKVSQVEIGAAPVPFEAEGDDPLTLRFSVPERILDSLPEVVVHAEAGGRKVTLRAPVRVLAGHNPEFDRHLAPPPMLPPTKKRFRLDLVPEGAGLIARLDNRLYLRVRDADGAPVGGARIAVEHASLPGKLLVVKSDASGLARFRLKADRPSYRLVMKVDKGEERAEFERTIVPAGRQLLLRADRAVVAPGDTAEVRFITWKQRPRVFCDVRRGPVWLWGTTLDAVDEDTRLQVGPFPPGRYDVQCYFHPHSPGRTWATLPLVVGDGTARELLTERVADAGLLHSGALPLAPESKDRLAHGYLQALLNAEPVQPKRLVNTRPTDMEAREVAWDEKKTVVLLALGGVLVLVLILVFDLILANVLATRDRMRAYAAELAEDEDEPDPELDDLTVMPHKSREGLVKTRGVLMVVLVGGTLIANVIAFIALMALIR